jgi:hypothetical protein
MCSLGCRPTGIVIDAFGGLRDKKDAEEEDIKVMSQSAETYMIFCIASAHQNCSCIAALWPNAPLSPLQANCFVCNLDRFSLDQRGIGFDRHIVRPRSPGHPAQSPCAASSRALALRCLSARSALRQVVEHNPRYYLFFLLAIKQKTRGQFGSADIPDIGGVATLTQIVRPRREDVEPGAVRTGAGLAGRWCQQLVPLVSERRGPVRLRALSS